MRCNWKRRFNSAAFEKLSHRLGGWAGHVIAKVVEGRAQTFKFRVCRRRCRCGCLSVSVSVSVSFFFSSVSVFPLSLSTSSTFGR